YSKLVAVPQALNGARGTVPRPALTVEQMQAHIAEYPPAGDQAHTGSGSAGNGGAAGAQGGKSHKGIDARADLAEHQIATSRDRQGKQGETTFVWVQCVWNEAHENAHAAIVQQWADGRITAKCSHNGCAGKTWTDFRDAVEGPSAAQPSQSEALLS